MAFDTVPTDALDDFLVLANDLADRARPVSMSYFRQPVPIEIKADESPVTRADRETEEAIRELLAKRVPDHGILGEEHGQEGLDRDLVWVIDPIDGTRAFITGTPLFGTLIALAYRGRPVLGIIDMPALNERFVGAVGRPTLFNGKPVPGPRNVTRLADAQFFTTSPDMFQGADRAAMENLSRDCRFRRFGGDCYNYGLIALGGADIVLERDLKPYDFMSLVPVLEGCGASIVDWAGRPLSITSSGQVLATATTELRDASLPYLDRLEP